MSLRWTSELGLQLHLRSCQAERWGPGWSARPRATATGSGLGAASIGAALDALQRADPQPWRGRVRMTVDDEFAHHTLITLPSPPWLAPQRQQAALALARQQFRQALGTDELIVRVRAMGNTRTWLASAVAQEDVRQWRQALEARGLGTGRITTTLGDDLLRLRTRIADPDAVVALAREEGVALVRLLQRIPVAIGWETLDPQDHGQLSRRLHAFVHQPGFRHDSVVYLQAESRTLCRYRWSAD
ncbi:hypothetical protein C7444_11244 [Sphaerotilus hippei]|uniref:Uncharacterized protein n=1 Tax=Sphaerotilus hippei TaxID=744406 RepID=A0A318GXV0_9BURK|nr:hypothetical protein [Sphaerotilus hippei]PXW94729.1 hypothetical protein C7444_11244 [Sphaerotilus hippei]